MMLSRCEDSLEQDALDYRFQAADQSEVNKSNYYKNQSY